MNPSQLADPQDFLALLDDKLRRRNERLMRRLLAWGELLDVAGWCVALHLTDSDFWLSNEAKRDLKKLKKPLTTWSGLLKSVDRFPEESFHLKSEAVLIWSGKTPKDRTPEPKERLTRREAEVMSWLRQGKTSLEIAIILGCATRTVEKHVANLYRKIGVRSRAAAILSKAKSLD